MEKIPLLIGFRASQVVQDFFQQQSAVFKDLLSFVKASSWTIAFHIQKNLVSSQKHGVMAMRMSSRSHVISVIFRLGDSAHHENTMLHTLLNLYLYIYICITCFQTLNTMFSSFSLCHQLPFFVAYTVLPPCPFSIPSHGVAGENLSHRSQRMGWWYSVSSFGLIFFVEWQHPKWLSRFSWMWCLNRMMYQ